MNNQEITVTIKQDGLVDFDMIGFEGQECSKAVKVFLDALGGEVKRTQNEDYYKKNKVRINQRRMWLIILLVNNFIIDLNY